MPVSLSDFRQLRDPILQEIESSQSAPSKDCPLSSDAIRAVSSWSMVEQAMLELFVFLLRGNRHRVAASFKAVNCFRTKCNMIAAAAKNGLFETRFTTLEKLLSVTLKAKRRRDRLEAWAWGYSDTFPNALLLIKPSDDSSAAHSGRDILVYQGHELKNMVCEHSRIARCLDLYRKLTVVEGDPVEASERLMEWLGI